MYEYPKTGGCAHSGVGGKGTSMGFLTWLRTHMGVQAAARSATAKKRPVQMPKSRAPGRIPFDPNLIRRLKDDHHDLFRLYAELVSLRDKGDYARIPRLLKEFKLTLQAHLRVENVQFYAYLQQENARDRKVAGIIVDVRKEMEAIARNALRFVSTYAAVQDFSPELQAAFVNELSAIGDVLTKRVAMEESSLYALYQEPRT
jgi:hypothetical protein